MAKPAPKHPQIEAYLEEQFGRTTAIEGDRCVNPPVGCGGPATEFDGELSRREYAISGLCQECQNIVFAEPDEDD